MLVDDYRGPFDPDFTLDRFSRQALADLAREFLLNGHMQDRAGLPRVFLMSDDKALTKVSIEEWMGASPIYSKRMQRALNFEGSEVGTIFKNLQLDIGAPHQFMEVRFDLNSPTYGEFWLECCGPLMDVEPFGEERVRLMCHDVEDPTFDATAAATHPCAKIRPIHRPPRLPSGRVPHCRWKVFIEGDETPYQQHENVEQVGRSRLANLEISLPNGNSEPGGWQDYAGDFDPEFQFEDLSHRALVTCNLEFALQGHLLVRSFLLSVDQNFGAAVAEKIAAQQWSGVAGLTAQRLAAALGLDRADDAGLQSIAKVFQLHPCFLPRDYIDLRVELQEDAVRLGFGPCPAFEEGDTYSWFAHLSTTPHPALECIARAIAPQAHLHTAPTSGDEKFAYRVTIDSDCEAARESEDVRLTKLSGGARIVFQRRRPLRD